MIDRRLIVKEAKTWLGTPWHHGQSVKGIGVDCIGLISGVADKLGLPEAQQWREDLEFKNYGRLPLPVKLLAACKKYLDEIGIDELQPGDVMLFTMLRDPMHFGIMSSQVPRYMIHAYEPIGQVVENIVDQRWQRRMLRGFRLRGVD